MPAAERFVTRSFASRCRELLEMVLAARGQKLEKRCLPRRSGHWRLWLSDQATSTGRDDSEDGASNVRLLPGPACRRRRCSPGAELASSHPYRPRFSNARSRGTW